MNFLSIFLVCLSANACIVQCGGSRILGIFPTPSVSHQVVYRALAEELARRGHLVVAATADPVRYSDPELANLTQIDLHDVSYGLWNETFDRESKMAHKPEPEDLIMVWFRFMLALSDAQLREPGMKTLISDPDEKFDLCIFEAFSSVMMAFKDTFDCPMIIVSSFFAPIHYLESMGNPTHPILYKEFFTMTGQSDSVWDRIVRVYKHLRLRYMYLWIALPGMNDLAKKHFGVNIRPLEEIELETSMLFINENSILRGARPTVPGIVYLGGLHIRKTKPIPAELLAVLDGADRGVVYFSLGSNVKSRDLSPAVRDAFLAAFSEMPYTIIWKWEVEELDDKPENVYISRWLPQNDLLSHPNVKVFITQGGRQSMDEAIHHGVPLVGMPFIVDQDFNVQLVLKFGIGRSLDVHSVTKELIKHTVSDVAEDPKYRQNIKKLSSLLEDQPETSLERAVWWTEYVLRHGGASHLRSPSADARWWQYFMLDIVAALLGASAAAALAIYLTTRAIALALKSLQKKIWKRKVS